MKIVRILIIVLIALVVNYSSGWTYEKGTENKTPIRDTVIVPASKRYAKMNPLKWFFLGRNYRREWSVPVAMPVFHVKSTMGGFTIEKMGGGQQTKSLHLVNANGSEWVLRSVDKTVEGAISPKIRNTFIQDIVQDQVSASHPYSLLTIHDLASAVGVIAPTAELYYVPDDPALDTFLPFFRHSVCILLPKLIEGFGTETEDTEDAQQQMDSTNHFAVLQEQVLRARLLDMLIADWDRHQKQWEWVMVDSGHTTYFHPVPEDRDQAFFLAQGALPFIMKMIALPHMVGFKPKSNKLIKLNRKAHDFDRHFMNELDRLSWIRIIRDFQSSLTDAVIHRAVSRMPREVYVISGKEIESRLKSRRDGLLEYGLEYYDFLASEVTLWSTRTTEQFVLSNRADTSFVQVHRQSDNKLIYKRAFMPGETAKIVITNVDESDKINRSTYTGPLKIEVVKRPDTSATTVSP